VKRPYSIRVVQYNIGDGPDHIKLGELEDLLKEDNPQVFFLDETADRLKVIKAFCSLHPEFDYWMGDGRPGAAKTTIVYLKSLGKVTGKYSETLVGKRRLAKGAGPENASPKVENRIRIRTPEGKRLHLIVAHQYATVVKRRVAARLFLRALVNVVKRRFGIVIFAGDMNQDPLAKMHKALRKVLPFFTNKFSTWGKRVIDVIWVNRKARIVKYWTEQYTSDHRAVVADIIY